MCLYGFASVPRQASVLKAFGRSFQASLPLYERSVGFASVQSLWAFISGILALLAPPVTSTADITASLVNSLPSA